MKINNYWENNKPQKRHNRTYKGSLTKRNKEKRDKRMLIFIAIWLTTIAYNAIASTSNQFIISNDKVVEGFSTASEATLPVTPERAELETALPEQVINAVMVETEKSNEMQIRMIAREFDFKWENYLVNLACCEGLLKTDTINDKGNSPSWSIDRGLYGINNYWHSEVSDFTAHNLRLSTIWTMNHINNGKQHEFICDKRIRGNENFYLRCLN